MVDNPREMATLSKKSADSQQWQQRGAVSMLALSSQTFSPRYATFSPFFARFVTL